MKFKAELKSTSQAKAASLDNVYKIVLITDNSDIMDLGKLPPDTIFDVEIKHDAN